MKPWSVVVGLNKLVCMYGLPQSVSGLVQTNLLIGVGIRGIYPSSGLRLRLRS